MGIKITNINAVDWNQIAFNITGDGEATVIKIKGTDQTFNGMKPDSYDVTCEVEGTAVINPVDNTVTVTFDTPPPTVSLNVYLTAVYNGL